MDGSKLFSYSKGGMLKNIVWSQYKQFEKGEFELGFTSISKHNAIIYTVCWDRKKRFSCFY